MILVIADLRRWEREGRGVPRLDGFRFIAFEALDRAALADPVPEMVVSALMDDGFDAIDVALCLGELGFIGRYWVVTAPLANADAVRREVAAAAPGLDVDLFILGPGA